MKLTRPQSAYLARARRNGYRVISRHLEADGTMVVTFRDAATGDRIGPLEVSR